MSDRKHNPENTIRIKALDMPVSPRPEAETELQNAMRKFCEDVERRNKPEESEALKGVLAALEREPRDE